MALIVQKFGGSSVRDVERMREVARRVIEERDAGNEVAVVVSAMGKTTDNLLAMAAEATADPPAREIDMLLSTGEQVSVAMLSMVIQSMGRPASSFTGIQAGFRTDRAHRRARITAVQADRIKRELEAGRVAVVAGFQGVSEEGDITTLGRGGSDTTAVALAAALKADRCDIYTDVDGVYTADPRVVPDASLNEVVTYDEMLELASLGAKVLHGRSVELAKNHRVPLRVLSSYSRHPGTMVVEEHKQMEKIVVSGIACNRNEIKISMVGVPDRPGVAASLFGRLGEAGISVNMIVQNLGSDGRNDISFTISKEDAAKGMELAEAAKAELGARAVQAERDVVIVSVVGVGMRSHSGVASRIFKAMAAAGINIEMISTSEISISCLLKESGADSAVRAIHAEFGLGSGTHITVPSR